MFSKAFFFRVAKSMNCELKRVNSSPNDLSKLKAFADDNIIVTQNLRFALGRLENIVGKGENAGYQHFLFFPQRFQKLSFSGSLKVGIVWERVNQYHMTLSLWLTHSLSPPPITRRQHFSV